MLATKSVTAPTQSCDRECPRLRVSCPARIRIGKRQYFGYLENISQTGAKLRTVTPIRKTGAVIIRLPDLPPLKCELRWNGPNDAGVAFEIALSQPQLRRWAESRQTSEHRRALRKNSLAIG